MDTKKALQELYWFPTKGDPMNQAKVHNDIIDLLMTLEDKDILHELFGLRNEINNLIERFNLSI